MTYLSTARNEGQQLFKLNKKVIGSPFTVGDAFNALAFRHANYDIGFDPLIMVDHYTMTGTTFGAHPHAGLSAVSIIFEDSVGKFHNRDSLGNDFDINPGDLYWLKAGSGVFHDEEPREGARIHGLQVFVNMPNEKKNDTPESLHIKAADMPIIESEGARVRILLGSCNGITSKQSPSTPLTILDGSIEKAKHFTFAVNEGEDAWIYAISGALQIEVGSSSVTLENGASVSLKSEINDLRVHLANTGSEVARFAVLSGQPLNEPFFQQGPLVAADPSFMARTLARQAKGLFGTIPPKE
ncbi:pirin family protein [Pseudidiomarina aestuarii]|uniref:pirin family protein n=1 Tax=Pseudidiomarina aestuarii TaxID=624146 RepID=UPI003A971361